MGRVSDRSRLLLSVTLLLAGTALLSCGGSERPRVLWLGDSITALVTDDLQAEGADDFEYTLRSTNGATSGDMLEVARQVESIPFSQIIVNLGTNDPGRGLTPDQTEANLVAILDLFPDASCVHLTTVNENLLAFGHPEAPEEAAQINERLRSIDEAEERVDLIDWNATVTEYLDEEEPDGPILSDSVHPTDVGQAILVDLYLDALEGCG